MASTDTARWRLKRETDAAHARLDAALSALDLTDPHDYATFLRVNAAILPSIERALEAAGIAVLLPDWSERARRDALLADLDGIGEGSASSAMPVSPPSGAAEAMGMAYVLEGSRLGGALLARRAAASGDERVLANRRFLTHGRPRLWPDFVVRLDALIDEANLAEAVAGANVAFALYADALAQTRVPLTPAGTAP